MTNNTVYGVEDSFTIGDVVVKVLPFQWTDETVYSGGILIVDDLLSAGGSGPDLNLNNVCLGFDFGRSIREISLKFGEYGMELRIDDIEVLW